MNLNDMPNRIASIESEQSVLGSLLLENNAVDRLGDLKTEHFYLAEHRSIFTEIVRQISAGKTCDVISLFEPLRGKVEDVLQYLNSLVSNTPSSANIRRYADVVVDRAIKRSLVSLGSEIQEMASVSQEDAATLVDSLAAKIDVLAQKKTHSVPVRMSDSMGEYIELLESRMEGRIKPIASGFTDLDRKLNGGLQRGTLTVIAARPGMGKTAMGLALCRNVSEWGSACFLSMEMDRGQVNDRNIAALGRLPLSWLGNPTGNDTDAWNRFTMACQKVNDLNLYIDDETSLSMLDIRNKARQVKRKSGLDILVIDQLSFIKGGGNKDTKKYELIGEYTRGLIELAKQLNVAVVLLCQLNRDCENRNNKRPQLSDLAMSGSIEQDAANVFFLYRDEIYNPDSNDKGVCEVICSKQRQGETGTVALAYVGTQTRFEDLQYRWQPPNIKDQPKSRGFD